ncbi:hypothetical protein I6A81_01540 [Frankia sp. CN7]|nr:hypothetical protein [Frankia nepalensis]
MPAATAVKAVKAVVAGGHGAKAAPLPRIRQALALGERRPVALCDAREPPGRQENGDLPGPPRPRHSPR